ncbi:hypothetical protein EPO34_02785 [Patescibacteria group bacterium]|nr:MAG: hypothetical protein EPO34_02785 [Patescibacteria group bacterium]
MRTPRYHVIFDIDHADPVIRDAGALSRFIKETVESIGMSVIAGPTVCEGIPENPGLSGFAVLDFSHISVHTFTNHDEALIDIFSCKPFVIELVRDRCLTAFGTPDSIVREKTVWWG